MISPTELILRFVQHGGRSAPPPPLWGVRRQRRRIEWAAAGLSAASAISAALLLAACPGPGFSADRPDPGAGGKDSVDCSESPLSNPNVVSDMCGVFVAPSGSDATGDGTKASPFATIGKAISIAMNGGRRVFACSGDYDETVVAPAGLQLYGARDCAGSWGRSDARSALRGSAGEITLRLLANAGGAATFIDGFRFESAAATMPGGSSIAALAVSGALAELNDCELVAGAGKDGAPGMDAPTQPPPTAQLAPENSGVSTDCPAMTGLDNSGGALHSISCLAGDFSVGGAGGDGSVLAGYDGETGIPKLGGGAGGVKNGSCMPGGAGNGSPGADGSPGMNGPGGLGDGMLSPAKGWLGVPGSDGGAGTPGQGGGGGAGQTGKFMCAGASGGSGGAGGCGGLGGLGGGAGGSSIALVSINAAVTISGGKLDAASGGDGGPGGDAQTGGMGSDGAPGGNGDSMLMLSGGCKGGIGGTGGPGGQGGGGVGGHSVAVAYAGSPPTGTFDALFGPPGKGGKGGFDDSSLNHGSDGKSQASLKIDAVAPN